MNFEYLNKMVSYIEEHLSEKTDYKKLAQIVGLSEYTLQRIFQFLTGISLSEYIRKRRLSKAFEELKSSDKKVIDIAVKYGYESAVSFSRAFKQCFGMTPSECRKMDSSFMVFPIVVFNNEDTAGENVRYEIQDVDELVLNCYGVKASTKDDMHFKIRELYRELDEKGILKDLMEEGVYGISDCKDGKYDYYVGTAKELAESITLTIPGGKYAVFEVGSQKQPDILKVYRFVYGIWIKSTDYEILQSPEIEYYSNGNCYIYFKIANKQN